jgi:hypothetical protein
MTLRLNGTAHFEQFMKRYTNWKFCRKNIEGDHKDLQLKNIRSIRVFIKMTSCRYSFNGIKLV